MTTQTHEYEYPELHWSIIFHWTLGKLLPIFVSAFWMGEFYMLILIRVVGVKEAPVRWNKCASSQSANHSRKVARHTSSQAARYNNVLSFIILYYIKNPDFLTKAKVKVAAHTHTHTGGQLDRHTHEHTDNLYTNATAEGRTIRNALNVTCRWLMACVGLMICRWPFISRKTLSSNSFFLCCFEVLWH